MSTDRSDCPHCGLRVSFSGDCVCPGCGEHVPAASLNAPEDGSDSLANPYLSPTEANTLATAPEGSGLTMGEQIFTAIVILFAGAVLVGLALFHFVIIPRIADPGVLYFIISLYWLAFVAIGVTVYLNLRKRRLLVIPTFIQSVLMCLTVWLIPAGIAGFYLLYRSEERYRQRPECDL